MHCLKPSLSILPLAFLLGIEADGVASFKGIRFAHPPIDNLRWEPPLPFVSSDAQNTTSLGPSCVQQIPFQGQALVDELYNTPAPPEDEDCLNVWAPAPISGPLKPVIVWFYGGAFLFGTASLPLYDGTSFAKNQDVLFVSFNYRTNVFGFPTASDLLPSDNNLGFLDQELAVAWVQDNGQSAGGEPVSLAISRRNASVVPPFRAAIMLSGVQYSTFPELDCSIFDAFAAAVGCTQQPGTVRLQCLRNVPASTIRAYTNGPNSGPFSPGVDNVTIFDDPLQRIRAGLIAKVPILLGSLQDDGIVLALSTFPNVSVFLAEQFGPLGVSFLPALPQVLYPGLNDTQLLAAVVRDVSFHCPTKLWSDAFVSSGIKSVYRYMYGATFANLRSISNLGVWHGSELPILFGTFNKSTATAAEVELSQNFQTAFANFVKDPVNTPPAPNWPRYQPGLLGSAIAPTLAKIAYHENVQLDNFIELVEPISVDQQCIVWDPFLSFHP
ncbi:Alpha/Beta hydrolase protein [Russula compacta]|nr:Alpha/Beta hydrolase protein [Russula compacta]